MDYEAQLKLQAYLDGELPEAEALGVAKWLAQDREPVALLAELRNTRQALAQAEAPRTLPESREFFWSKIQREIQRQEQPQPAPARASLWESWRRFFVPAGALAALALAIFITLSSGSSDSIVETAIADPAAFTYHDFSSRTTLVWFSYPAENDVADPSAPATVD